MSREIKFRFWSGDKMFTETKGVMACLTQQMLFDENAPIGIQYDHGGKHGAAFMQFTGLKDSKGVEIYEGDIRIAEYFVMTENQKTVSVMEWDAQAPGFRWVDRGYWPDFVDTVVAGNIHQHPELLSQNSTPVGGGK